MAPAIPTRTETEADHARAPAELTAELTIAPGDDRAVAAGREAAAQTGLALDSGPTTTALSGARREVLDALSRVLDAALSAGATTVEVKLEVPSDAREYA